ncbi:hypothetical protein LTR36_011002 [Oleoguttula mirabilis]|uniref:Heterokaryon incompatibility domain-containing protein n=1 Tax=Oleoguttula mirabilis TaxID=1507867 RepID=A0AAV9J3U1_9PEZI|nr:hypothetical protein LTR36_011002 [Oleoguttula mirabilis]
MAPAYTAVSYTWGAEAATEVIRIDGFSFPVKPNLWSCLYYLRQSEWRYLWVDAICINQNDSSEKTEQVRVIDRIYGDAAVVSAWLGLLPFPDWQHWLVQSTPTLRLDSDDFDWLDALQELANRPYWSRVWVIQEMLVAKHVHIYCSGQRVDFPDFKMMLEREVGKELVDGELVDKMSRSSASRKYQALPLVLGRHVDKHPEMQQPLYDLLLNHRRAECKDPRDRVFALLSLVIPDERAILGSFFPNYSLSPDDVVMITLSYFIEIDENRFERRPINAHSHTLFCALGVFSQKRAQRLFWAAKHFHLEDHMAKKHNRPFTVEYPWHFHEGPNGEELVDTEDDAGPEEDSDGESVATVNDIEQSISKSRPRLSWPRWPMRRAVLIALFIGMGSLVKTLVERRSSWRL